VVVGWERFDKFDLVTDGGQIQSVIVSEDNSKSIARLVE
jgi:hypothetical protein